MEHTIYQRPREKLLYDGPGSLSIVELLQLVIGAGSKQVSGAALAKEVSLLIALGTVDYASLISLNGIGKAKACQILGMYELVKRLGDHE